MSISEFKKAAASAADSMEHALGPLDSTNHDVFVEGGVDLGALAERMETERESCISSLHAASNDLNGTLGSVMLLEMYLAELPQDEITEITDAMTAAGESHGTAAERINDATNVCEGIQGLSTDYKLAGSALTKAPYPVLGSFNELSAALDRTNRLIREL